MTEVEHLQSVIDDAKTRLKQTKLEEQMSAGAKIVFAFYESFLKAGFSESQAWKLTLIAFVKK